MFHIAGECSTSNCVEDDVAINANKWSLPLLRSGEKKLYLGIFFKVKRLNGWYFFHTKF